MSLALVSELGDQGAVVEEMQVAEEVAFHVTPRVASQTPGPPADRGAVARPLLAAGRGDDRGL